MTSNKQVLLTFALAVLALPSAMLMAQQSGGTPAAQAAPIPSVFIRILPHRMEPMTMTVNAGPLLMIVQNRSTAPNLTLRLDQVSGGLIKSIPMPSGQRHSLAAYNLVPGQYVLSEANHPAWRCRITAK